MSLAVARTKLVTSLKDLHQRWDVVQHEWDDPVARKFRVEYIDQLEGRVRATVSAIEEMSAKIAKAKSDCGSSETW